MIVMIVSSPGDVHAQAVMEALSDSGVDIELLDLSEFPTRISLSMEFENSKHRFCLHRTGCAKLDLLTISAAWWRRPQPFRFPAALTETAHRRFALSEAATAFAGLYQSMDAFWVNDPRRDSAAQHKPWQLALAQQIGLEIPVTLMTSDPEEARDFWMRFEDCIIYKPFLSLPEAWRETRRLRAEEIPLSQSVRTTPVIFQRYVDAIADVRATIVGDDIFAASTDVREGEYPTDVRFNPDARFEFHLLPTDVQDALRSMMRRMGLEYGAVDLRLTPEGTYVFLEINPAGQFLWIEIATGQKIASSLAAHLVKGAKMRAELRTN